VSVDGISEKSTFAPICVDQNTKISDCSDWFDNALAHTDVQFICGQFSQIRR